MTLQNTDIEQTDKITAHLEEVLPVRLTRREIYWLRKQSMKRLKAAEQCMSDPKASPAKHSKGYHEYCFHRTLTDHLYGVELSEEEYIRQCKEDAQRAAEMLESHKKRIEEQVAQLQLIASGLEIPQ